MDVNEQIAKAYFEEVHGYMVKTNHYFKKVRDTGSGPADIDLILYHPREGNFGKQAICSVKGWQSQTIRLKAIKDKPTFEENWRIFEDQEISEGERFFGNKDFAKILILPPIHKSEKKEAKKYCEKEYKIQLLDFSDILIELIEHLSNPSNLNRAYDIEALQVLRMVLINIVQIVGEKIYIQSSLVNRMNLSKDNFETEFKNNRVNKKIIIKSK